MAIPGLPSRAAIAVSRSVFRPEVNMLMKLLMRIQSTFLLTSFGIDYNMGKDVLIHGTRVRALVMPLLINAACTKAVIYIHRTPSLESNSIIFESGGCKYVGCVSAFFGVQDGASGLCSHVRRRASALKQSNFLRRYHYYSEFVYGHRNYAYALWN